MKKALAMLPETQAVETAVARRGAVHRARHSPFVSLLCRDTLPLLYDSMPKSGCTTIENVICAIDTGRCYTYPLAIHRDKDALVSWQVSDPERSRRLLRRRLDKRVISFTFARHPGRRSYSALNERICAVHRYSFPRVRDCIGGQYGARFAAKNNTIEYHRDNFRKFLSFVRDNVAGKTVKRRDPHWLPQANILRSWHRPGVSVATNFRS